MTVGRLESVRVQNFKAIRDTKSVKLTPLTALIGDNGSGKSSLIEALETYQAIVTAGLDAALDRWLGYEHVHNHAVPSGPGKLKVLRLHQRNPVSFRFLFGSNRNTLTADLIINASPSLDEVFIQRESLISGNDTLVKRDESGRVEDSTGTVYRSVQPAPDGDSILPEVRSELPLVGEFAQSVPRWQFLLLNPDSMGSPRPRSRTGGEIRLARDGANVAEYLLDISRRDPEAFAGILEAMQYVVPYVRDLRPSITSELERSVYLQMTEGDFKVPGWLLSSGTLRVLALLALMRHPNPPPLIVVEEIENGLDPRTIGLLVEEMRALVQSGRSQIILTTHSPYLLDLLALEQIVLVERVDGQPVFTRPADQAALAGWAEQFSPGQLYTMGRLQGERA